MLQQSELSSEKFISQEEKWTNLEEQESVPFIMTFCLETHLLISGGVCVLKGIHSYLQVRQVVPHQIRNQKQLRMCSPSGLRGLLAYSEPRPAAL